MHKNNTDIHIKMGTIYNGSGAASFVGEAISTSITYVGPSIEVKAKKVVDAPQSRSSWIY